MVGWFLLYINPCRLFNTQPYYFIYIKYVNTFLGNIFNKPGFICLHTVEYFQVLLINTKNFLFNINYLFAYS